MLSTEEILNYREEKNELEEVDTNVEFDTKVEELFY